VALVGIANKGKLGKYALLTQHLVDIAKSVDTTRPVLAACNDTGDNNPHFNRELLIRFNSIITQVNMPV
jgi:hypothetical protein